MNEVSIFGSTGFIGSRYCGMFPNESIKILREENSTHVGKILYFISTVTNYNIFEDPLKDINTNMLKLVSVLEANKELENFEFNFISSWFVYGEQGDAVVKEDAYCDPKGFYSITKRAAEQMLISFCETYGLNYRIIRLCNVIGKGDVKSSRKKNALQYMIERLKKGEDVSLYDGGAHIREYMHVDDVCCAIKMIIEKGNLNEIYNVSPCDPVTIGEMISYAKQKIGSKSKINSMKTPEFHKIVQTKDIRIDNTKLTRLGFKPRYDVWQSIDLLID
jgi:nucleoside-diphosphate-sugar epimerase